MKRMLEDKVALVTGAAGGIGRSSALLFAAEGAKVAVADRNAAGAEETVALIHEQGGDALALNVDVTNRTQVDTMVSKIVETYGRLDCAFNNAGITGGQIGQGGRFTADWDEEAFDNILNVNLKGTWLCMRAELKQMMAQGGGSILSTASLAGLCGFPTTTGYSASKHGVVGITKTAAMEYAPTVRLNALCPGYIDTDMLKDTMSRRGELILSQIPSGRLGSGNEMAEMACWLLSDRASYATGQAFTVDGGFMAG
ncbi:short-chain dehydrogenase [Sulfitobacter sp. EhC04]|uniref:glucose 1-dehydrogenase n=1 Tax=Sulfitobacter sp. EhC04 TaxID=1849168 RepID=UPI0007F364F1|nr:glucose 1-dehydrogenase [Sulfitobacter sp. EhC04]OAN75940.1 short-chain dehydrogenase [Sulfitobacter sp. EhC04]